MKTIQTKPDCTLGFISISEKIKLGHESVGSSDLRLKPGKFIEIIHTSGHALIVEIIGKLSEVTEEQARGLVSEDNWWNGPMYRDYIADQTLKRPHMWDYAVVSLKSVALSVGIEEKDFSSYLVIKL